MTSTISFGHDTVVITGIGMMTAVGLTRESTWWGVQQGRSGVTTMRDIPGIEGSTLPAAMVDIPVTGKNELKSISMAYATSQEALDDAGIRFSDIDRTRFGTYISGGMGDAHFVHEKVGLDRPHHPFRAQWHDQWMPHTAGAKVRQKFELLGPCNSHLTACASSTIDLLCARRAILDDQCDIALTGAAEFIHPLFASGFHNMRALAEHPDPTQACRPFDAERNGFVMGEGSAMLVVERLSHARRRGATIYAEVLGGTIAGDANHLTGIEAKNSAVSHVIRTTLRNANLSPSDIDYISAHGTGTLQNDFAETCGIREAFGKKADQIYINSLKSMIGHLVNASGCVEIALTALSLRDGFTPPTINLTHPDPNCDLDYVPLVGRRRAAEHALKLSLAFGGHIAAVALKRWDRANETRSAQPLIAAA